MEGVQLKNFGSRCKTLRSSSAIRLAMAAISATTDAILYLKVIVELRPGYTWSREVGFEALLICSLARRVGEKKSSSELSPLAPTKMYQDQCKNLTNLSPLRHPHFLQAPRTQPELPLPRWTHPGPCSRYLSRPCFQKKACHLQGQAQ